MSGIAQTSANSTQEKISPTVTADLKTEIAQTQAEVSGLRADIAERQLARLIREVKTARALIDRQEIQIDVLQAQLGLEITNATSLTASYQSAQREIVTVRLAIASAQETIAAKNETIAVLTHQRDEERKKRKKANKRAVLAGLGAAAIFILRVIK